MSKFTQGPWLYDGVAFIEDNHNYRLAMTYLYGIENIEVNNANGRLIAAAPEMYKLLYEALQVIRGLNPGESQIGISTIAPDIEKILLRIDGKE